MQPHDQLALSLQWRDDSDPKQFPALKTNCSLNPQVADNSFGFRRPSIAEPKEAKTAGSDRETRAAHRPGRRALEAKFTSDAVQRSRRPVCKPKCGRWTRVPIPAGLQGPACIAPGRQAPFRDSGAMEPGK